MQESKIKTRKNRGFTLIELLVVMAILTLLAHGTEYQKEKFLKPLLNGEKRICYSMTEKAAGADATGMQTTAVKDGNENYILNGEKWFSSGASAADIVVIMAKTNPEAPRHQQFSTFIVELPNPGYRIIRDIKTMTPESPLAHIMGGGHAEVEIKNLVVSADNLLGGEGNGFGMGQHRLAYGRLRHGMHNIAMAQRALDLGASFSVSGILSFKAATDVRAVISKVPLERIILETDCPYLAPIPHRGRRNEPAYLVDVCRAFADYRGMSFEDAARLTTANAIRLFQRAPE